jgi:hypothetical protein
LVLPNETGNQAEENQENKTGRSVKIQVTTDTSPALTATFDITTIVPDGKLKSRHAGPKPTGIEIPNPEQEFSSKYSPVGDQIGAESTLLVIPMPGKVNFGGDFDKGVYVIEIDKGSPPKRGTYTPAEGSAFAKEKHRTRDQYSKIETGTAAFPDQIRYRKTELAMQYITTTYTCVWRCEFRWRDGDGAETYNKTKTGGNGGVAFQHAFQKFSLSLADGTVPQRAVTTISKFNSSVTRTSGGENIRDIQNNWKP